MEKLTAARDLNILAPRLVLVACLPPHTLKRTVVYMIKRHAVLGSFDNPSNLLLPENHGAIGHTNLSRHLFREMGQSGWCLQAWDVVVVLGEDIDTTQALLNGRHLDLGNVLGRNKDASPLLDGWRAQLRLYSPNGATLISNDSGLGLRDKKRSKAVRKGQVIPFEVPLAVMRAAQRSMAEAKALQPHDPLWEQASLLAEELKNALLGTKPAT